MVLQNISKPEVLLIKYEQVTEKNSKIQKIRKISKETDPNVQNNIQYKYFKNKYILQIFNYI